MLTSRRPPTASRNRPDVSARLAAIEARLDRLEHQDTARDPADVALLPHLARLFGSHTFTARAVLYQARLDPDLRLALERADVTSTRELGWLLRLLSRVDVSPFRVELARRSLGRAHAWRVVLVSLD